MHTSEIACVLLTAAVICVLTLTGCRSDAPSVEDPQMLELTSPAGALDAAGEPGGPEDESVTEVDRPADTEEPLEAEPSTETEPSPPTPPSAPPEPVSPQAPTPQEEHAGTSEPDPTATDRPAPPERLEGPPRGADGEGRPRMMRPGRMFEGMDADGDGTLTAEEIPVRLRERFMAADSDGNGAISRQELQQVRERMREAGEGRRGRRGGAPPAAGDGPRRGAGDATEPTR